MFRKVLTGGDKVEYYGTKWGEVVDGGGKWIIFSKVSKMFVGEYKHSVDDKGRVAVPAKFREVLEDGAILTRGNDGCLVIYRMNEWEILMEKIAKLPQSKPEARSYVRFITSGAIDIKLDKQGRINIPTYLMDFASLTKKVVFVGIYDKMEIWDQKKWDDYRLLIEGNSEEVLEGLESYGL